MDVEWDCATEDGEDVVVVAVGQESGRVYLFGPECAFNAMSEGGKVWVGGTPESVTWHGTHTLTG